MNFTLLIGLSYKPRGISDILQPISSQVQSIIGSSTTLVESAVRGPTIAALSARNIAALAIKSDINIAALVIESGANIAALAIESGANAIAIVAQNIANNFINENIPRNLLVGIEKLYLKYANSTRDYYILPLNISDIIPKVILDLLGDEIQTL